MINTTVTTHTSEAEAARDFAGLLTRVRAGAEVVIDSHVSPAVVQRVAGEPCLPRLSESLHLAREHRSTATLDVGFAADLEAVMGSHLRLIPGLSIVQF